MNKKTVISVVVVVLIIVAGVVWLKLMPKKVHKRVVGDCEVTVEEFAMPDGTMEGIYSSGQVLTLERGYYACNTPVPGDTVLYSYNSAIPPVVKRIVAVEGDEFKVIKDEQGRGWNLEVNGDLVETPEGETYYFGGQAPPPLSLYVEPRKGILGQSENIVFSTRPPGRDDSGRTGLVSSSDLLGRILPQKQSN